MRLLIYLAVWKRPEITKICFMGIDRLRNAGIHDIEALAVISEEEMKPLCATWNIEWVMYKNHPLGEKKNFGLRQALRVEFDYMVEIGSDDLLKTDLLNVYAWDRDVMGVNSVAFINADTGSCKMMSGKVGVFGAGRAIHRRVIEKLIDLWPDKASRGLDKCSSFRMASAGFLEKRYTTAEPLVIDIKSDVNIWGYRQISGISYPIAKALEGLGEQEIDAINALKCFKEGKT